MNGPAHPGFLQGGGETGALLRQLNWAETEIGAPEAWPDAMCCAVSLMLGAVGPVGVYWGADFRMLYNDAWSDMVGDRHPQALGCPLREVFPEFWTRLEPLLRSAMAGKGVLAQSTEPFRLSRKGRPVDSWFDYSFNPIRLADGRIGGVFGMATETTGRVLAERALREEAQRRAFLLALGDALRDQPDPRAVMATAAEMLGRHLAVDRVGYAEVEAADTHFTVDQDWCAPGMPTLAGRHRADDFGPDLVAELRLGHTVTIRDALTEGMSKDQHIAAAFRAASIGAAITVPLIKGGRLVAGFVVHSRMPRDWTEAEVALALGVAERTWAALEQARAEAALRRSEAWLRLALEAGQIGAWTLDVGADSAERSPLHDAIFGYRAPQAEWSLERAMSHIVPEDRAMVEAQFRAAVASGGEWRFECRIDRADGLRRWIAARGLPVFDSHGAVASFTGVVLDIDDRREAETRLRDLAASLEAQVEQRTAALLQSQEALVHAQKMEAVGQLTGGLAHDFNNLLAGISGSLDLMQRRAAQGRVEELSRYIGTAKEAANRAAALTHRLLAFTRRQTLAPRPTDVNRLVDGMEDLLRRTMGPSVRVEVATAPELWTTLVDPQQLENALLNLCINARDAMPDGGRLRIDTANRQIDASSALGLPPGPYVVLGVSDTGTGMTPEVRSRAFDPFFTTKPIGMGTGLGLSMVYGFAQQSGGHAHIASEPDDGARIQLYLPRHDGVAAPVAGPARPRPAPGAPRGDTVLVVDDEASIRMLVIDVLEEMGFTTLSAAIGKAGLEMLRMDRRIDLLITDVGLPGGMNGRQLAEAGRLLRPGLKVLFITGYADQAVLNHEHLAPGMETLTKPFAMDTLAERVRQICIGPNRETTN